MDKLFQNKEFWVAVVGGLIAIIGYFVGKYVPQFADDAKFLIAVIEPIIAIILGSLFVAGKVNALRAEVRTLGVRLLAK